MTKRYSVPAPTYTPGAILGLVTEQQVYNIKTKEKERKKTPGLYRDQIYILVSPSSQTQMGYE